MPVERICLAQAEAMSSRTAPERMTEPEKMPWYFEVACLEVSQGVGGVETCATYGALKREIIARTTEAANG